MLTVSRLSISFTTYETGWIEKQIRITSDLELQVNPGQVAAVIGSSGSGKSLLAHAILGILPRNAHFTGEIHFKGHPLTPEKQKNLRGNEIAMIPQSIGSLDPLMRVGKQIERAGCLAGRKKQEVDVKGILNRFHLPERIAILFPFQLSGGMARRVLMAVAAAGNADLIIADEPLPGLHEQAVSEVLSHLRKLADSGKAVLLITHDLVKSLKIADKVFVFYAGTTVEETSAGNFSGDGMKLKHPYSRALWDALPQNGFISISGSQPVISSSPLGCLFVDRCLMAKKDCGIKPPPVKPTADGFVRCLYA
jgi:peptide/nickel transport system ATP-binding protein